MWHDTSCPLYKTSPSLGDKDNDICVSSIWSKGCGKILDYCVGHHTARVIWIMIYI